LDGQRLNQLVLLALVVRELLQPMVDKQLMADWLQAAVVQAVLVLVQAVVQAVEQAAQVQMDLFGV
jgi:hypothetical protein